MQCQGGICQDIGEARPRQRRSDGAHNDMSWPTALTEQETADEHVVSRLNKGARADIGQFRIDRAIKVVDLQEGDAGSLVFAADDGGVAPGRQRNDDR